MHTASFEMLRQRLICTLVLKRVQWALLLAFLAVFSIPMAQKMANVVTLFTAENTIQQTFKTRSSATFQPVTEEEYSVLGNQLWFGAPVQTATKQVEEVAQETTLNLELKATIAGGASPRAVILDISSNESKMLKIGDEILPNVKLTAVQRRNVLIDNRGKKEALSLPVSSLSMPAPESGEVALATAPKQPTKRKAYAYVPLDMRKIDTYQKVTISKLDAIEALANLGALAKQARSIPVVSSKHGIQGYKFTRIQHDSLFKKISLKEGDTVVLVNGVHVKNKEKMFPVLTSLAKASKATLVLERGGKMISLDIILN